MKARSKVATPVGAAPVSPLPPQDVAEAIAAPEPTTPARRRSGVQVLLLTLGVVLISVAAIVFLFVAYLVANLEVRSVIIAAASILVLGMAWLLRARAPYLVSIGYAPNRQLWGGKAGGVKADAAGAGVVDRV